MTKFIRKYISYIYIIIVYFMILSQYPAGVSISRFVLHQNVEANMRPDYLLLWGLARILIVLPLLFTLMSKDGVDHEDIYLSFGDHKKVISITFWGTLAFTILGTLLYPWFINATSLTPFLFLQYLPIFLLYAISNAFIEESFFRGIGLHFLSKKSNFWVANLIQSFFFALIHINSPMTTNPLTFVILTFFLGLLWGILTNKYKSLVPAIALHVIADIFVAVSLF